MIGIWAGGSKHNGWGRLSDTPPLMLSSERYRTITQFNIYKIYFRFYILYICVLYTCIYLPCELFPRAPLLSVNNNLHTLQEEAILGAARWISFSCFCFCFFSSLVSFFFYLALTLSKERNIQLQNVACFYINQILFA